jgi:hypothetical protein
MPRELILVLIHHLFSGTGNYTGSVSGGTFTINKKTINGTFTVNYGYDSFLSAYI